MRPDLVHGSTKAWEAVVSTAFRQPFADSHCKDLHGYSLRFLATFEARELDANNWVVDFGAFKSFKGWLEHTFDHTTMIAEDDPQLAYFQEGHKRGVLNLRVVKRVGCEAFALLVFEHLECWLKEKGYSPRVELMRVDVHEHALNSAYVRRR